MTKFRPGAIEYDPDDDEQEDVEQEPEQRRPTRASSRAGATTEQPKSSALAPGSFVHSTRMALHPYGAECAFCGITTIGAAWVHVASSSVVCHSCMGNPYADDGERGRQVHDRLVSRLDSERVQPSETSELDRLEIL